MRKVVVLIICLLLFPDIYSQDILGKNRVALNDYMRQNFREYQMRNPLNAEELNFYKFEHNSGDKTIIAIFNEKGICETYQLILDMELLEETITELNKLCRLVETGTWLCSGSGKNIRVELKEKDWFIVLTNTIYTVAVQ